MTHRAYVVDPPEGPSAGLAKEHMGKQCDDEIGENVFAGAADIIREVAEEVSDESAAAQREGLEKAILAQLLNSPKGEFGDWRMQQAEFPDASLPKVKTFAGADVGDSRLAEQLLQKRIAA